MKNIKDSIEYKTLEVKIETLKLQLERKDIENNKLKKQLSIPLVSQQRELLYTVCDKLAEAIHKHPLPPSLKSAIINEVLADNCG